MSDDSKNGDRPAPVLTDGSKWWDFMDPTTNQVRTDLPTATRVTSDMLDWTSIRSTERNRAIGFGFYNRCNTCGQPAPPDFTFCIHCGGLPISPQSMKRYSIVIKDFDSEDAKQKVAEILASCGDGIRVGEVNAMLDELPAVFNVDARRDRVVTIVARLAELGVSSRSFPIEDISTLMLKETFETIARDTKQLAMFIGVLLLSVAAGFLWLPLSLVGLGFLAWRFHQRRNWYDTHYRLNDTQLLNIFCGFDDHTAEQAADVLRRTRDNDVRRWFTKCLMEYYSLHEFMRMHDDHYGGVLSGSRVALHELIEQVVETVTRFEGIQNALQGHDPARLRARLADVVQRANQNTDARTAQFLDQERHHLEAQVRQIETMRVTRDAFVARMEAMAQSLEALRNRVSNATAMRNDTDVSMEQILRALDDELDTFEQTFAELEPAVHIT
ncbi:MAG: hypothetical protein R3E66_07065 [bacterium]